MLCHTRKHEVFIASARVGGKDHWISIRNFTAVGPGRFALHRAGALFHQIEPPRAHRFSVKGASDKLQNTQNTSS
jgi:hypothetical protein